METVKNAVLLADPPWSFKTYSEKGDGRSASKHYDVMSVRDLESMKLPPLANDACLFMWATSPMMPEALHLMDAWGFTFKTTAFVWVKTNLDGTPFMGLGYWTRQNAEFCLLGTRGKPKRVRGDVRQIIMDVRREHSRKPACVHERIEALVDGPYCEMFARETRKGWTSYGNEIGKFDDCSDIL